MAKHRYFLRTFLRITFAMIMFSIVFLMYISFGYIGLTHHLETGNFLGQILTGSILVLGVLWFFAGSFIIGHEIQEYRRWGI